MKLFVYRFNGVVHKVIAQSVISDVEILFEGNVRAEIPQNIKDLLRDQKDLDDIKKQAEQQKRQNILAAEARLKLADLPAANSVAKLRDILIDVVEILTK